MRQPTDPAARMAGGIPMSAAAPLPELDTQPVDVTLLELVDVVNEIADNEDEVVATVIYMIERGSVRLRGNFRGERIRLD
jgi:phage terminase Nu1 subunit (DNA packaging protein)